MIFFILGKDFCGLKNLQLKKLNFFIKGNSLKKKLESLRSLPSCHEHIHYMDLGYYLHPDLPDLHTPLHLKPVLIEACKQWQNRPLE